jgi:hypothetical protein
VASKPRYNSQNVILERSEAPGLSFPEHSRFESTGRSSAAASKPRYISQNCTFERSGSTEHSFLYIYERSDAPEQLEQRFRAPSRQSVVNSSVFEVQPSIFTPTGLEWIAEPIYVYGCVYVVSPGDASGRKPPRKGFTNTYWTDPFAIWTDPCAIWTDPCAIWTDPCAIWIDAFAIWTDPCPI